MRATIFFLTFAVFIAAVVWRVDQVMFGDKLAWGEAQARSQMSAMVHAVDAEVERLRDILLLGYSEIELGKKDYAANRPYGRFQMVAKVLPPNLKDDKKDWRVVSSFFQEKSSVKSWAAPYVSMALKSIKENDVKLGSANMYSLMDPSRKPYLLVVVRGSGNWYAGLVGTEIFQGLMDQQKGQKSTAFVVNLQGQTLGHTIQEYTGSLLTEDPLVSELMKSSVGSGFGSFKDLKGNAIQGLYEQVERTNIYAVIATPIEHLTANRSEVRWQLILMGLGLGLIGLAYFVFSDRGAFQRQSPTPAMMPATTFPGMPSTTPAPATVAAPAPVNNVKMNAYTQVASSLSHELKTPLTSILGHAQLAMAQAEGASKEHLLKIEKEARTARDIVQKLLIFAGEDKVASQKMGLETVVNKALKLVEGKIISKGIKLQKNIQSVPQFTMASDLLVKAVENILLNSIEAMERVPKKELTVSLRSNGSQILLIIADTGEGIDSADLPKIFDPFFTTRTGTQHVGLGLSTAMGIFKEAFGDIQVESEKGKGTTVTVEVNPQDSLMAAGSSASNEITLPKIRVNSAINFPTMPTAKPAGPLTAPKAPGPAPMPNTAAKTSKVETLAPDPFDPTAPAATPTPAQMKSLDPSAAQMRDEELTISPLLVDNTIERMIEDDLSDVTDPVIEVKQMPTDKAQAVAKEAVDESTALITPEKAAAPSFSSKIDKPKIEKKKKSSRLDEFQVSVRRPGER